MQRVTMFQYHLATSVPRVSEKSDGGPRWYTLLIFSRVLVTLDHQCMGWSGWASCCPFLLPPLRAATAGCAQSARLPSYCRASNGCLHQPRNLQTRQPCHLSLVAATPPLPCAGVAMSRFPELIIKIVGHFPMVRETSLQTVHSY